MEYEELSEFKIGCMYDTKAYPLIYQIIYQNEKLFTEESQQRTHSSKANMKIIGGNIFSKTKRKE